MPSGFADAPLATASLSDQPASQDEEDALMTTLKQVQQENQQKLSQADEQFLQDQMMLLSGGPQSATKLLEQRQPTPPFPDIDLAPTSKAESSVPSAKASTTDVEPEVLPPSVANLSSSIRTSHYQNAVEESAEHSRVALASAVEELPQTPATEVPVASSTSALPGGEPASTPGDSPSTPVTVTISDDSPTSLQPKVGGESVVETTDSSSLDEEQAFRAGIWRESVSDAIQTLRKELGREDVDPSSRQRMQAYLRLLYVIENRHQQAVEPIEGILDDEQEFWKHQLYSLMVALDADQRHASSRRAALALRDLRTATNYLANLSTLDVRNVAFCQQVNSFGDYVEFKPYSFRAGAEVLLYVEVENFAAEQNGNQFETELQGEYTILDASGGRVANVVLPLDKQVCKNRRRDYFIAYRMFMPEKLRAGDYTLVLTIEDVRGNKSNQATLGFQVR